MPNNFEIHYDADCFIPQSSNHADRGIIENRAYLVFDGSTVEAMYSKAIQVPGTYTGSGTLKADIIYAVNGATGSINFEVSIEAITPGDALSTFFASSFDTVNSGTKTVPANSGYLDKLTITLTNKDSMSAGDMFRIKLERDADDGTDDTSTNDCMVFCVIIREEV